MPTSRSLPAAGAGARPGQDRARGGRGRAGRGDEAKKKLEEIYAGLRRADADFDKLAAEQAKYEAIHRHRRRRHRAPAGDRRPTRLRLPDWEAPIEHLSRAARSGGWHCAGCCFPKPDHAAARRAHQPPRRRERSSGWSSSCCAFPARWSASPTDRYFLDNACPVDSLELDRGYGIPWEGNYSSLAAAEGTAAGDGVEAGRRRASRR